MATFQFHPNSPLYLSDISCGLVLYMTFSMPDNAATTTTKQSTTTTTPAITTTTPTPTTTTAPTGPRSFERRDKLRRIEAIIREQWEQDKVFDVDAPNDADTLVQEKFFVTFPYPYMNGRLHLGHAFTTTKADFMAAYQRLKGKRVLFPFAFHCTGMPIQAAALKLKRELEDDEQGVGSEVAPAAATPAAPTSSATKADPTKFSGTKSKTSKKSLKNATQYDIMIKSGIKPEDVSKFVDPLYWLDYFPTLGEDDLRDFGLHCDWRRSFITTSKNPYYNSFVRWQFNTLHARGKLLRGKRPTICTPDDGQACADHDRASGEGVKTQDYTLVKLAVVQPPTNNNNAFAQLCATVGKEFSIVLVAATLRPETMFGQTNCYVLPTGTYGLYRVSDKEVFVCGEHAARNLSFQGFPSESGVMDCRGTIRGVDMVGTLVRAPLSKYDCVYVLPMETISMTIGTAVVTSVPSDSPDDWINYNILKTNDKVRDKVGVTAEMVKFDVVDIISIPGYDGRSAAPVVCERMKIKSPKDTALLKEAKDEVYLSGFESGIMLVPFDDQSEPRVRGMPVKEAKPIVRDYLIKTGLAVTYSEPASEVISRTGLVCIVKNLDQWYLPYGVDKAWCDEVKQHVMDPKRFDAYTAASLKSFEFTLDWLKEWACSRSFGLGTPLPAFTDKDKEGEFIIESLSDSTIYMAYYTVAHLLQGGERNYDGTLGKGGQCRIPVLTPQVMTHDAWDFIFTLSDKLPTGASPEVVAGLKELRKEFLFWYPMDLRVSGKDLIQNHLTMSLYNHAAVWQRSPHLWPKGFFTNGHILVEGVKMSKSKGNFILLEEAIRGHRDMEVRDDDDKVVAVKTVGWTADATRVALADGGDGLDDANFACDVADTAIMRLNNELKFAEDVVAMTPDEDKADGNKNNAAAEVMFRDIFLARIDKAIVDADSAYATMRYRDALVAAFYGLQDARDAYRHACTMVDASAKKSVLLRYLSVLSVILSPICPYFCDHVWRNVLKVSTSVLKASWPVPSTKAETRKITLAIGTYLDLIETRCRTQLDKYMTRQKISHVASVSIRVSKTVPAYQEFVLGILKSKYPNPDKSNIASSDVMKMVATELRGKAGAAFTKSTKDAMKAAATAFEEAQKIGSAAYETSMPFDEVQVLGVASTYFQKALGVDTFQSSLVDGSVRDPDAVTPGKPLIEFGSLSGGGGNKKE